MPVVQKALQHAQHKPVQPAINQISQDLNHRVNKANKMINKVYKKIRQNESMLTDDLANLNLHLHKVDKNLRQQKGKTADMQQLLLQGPIGKELLWWGRNLASVAWLVSALTAMVSCCELSQ